MSETREPAETHVPSTSAPGTGAQIYAPDLEVVEPCGTTGTSPGRPWYRSGVISR